MKLKIGIVMMIASVILGYKAYDISHSLFAYWMVSPESIRCFRTDKECQELIDLLDSLCHRGYRDICSVYDSYKNRLQKRRNKVSLLWTLCGVCGISGSFLTIISIRKFKSVREFGNIGK